MLISTHAKLSRRRFLSSGAALAGAFSSAIPSQGGTEKPSAASTPLTNDFLGGTLDAATWIRSTAKDENNGRSWLPSPDHPEKKTTISPAQAIYSGNAGIVLFFLELTRSTGDASYLGDAKRGADLLADSWQELLRSPERIPGSNLSFYNGVSGTAFVLSETWKTTHDRRYHEAAVAATEHIVSVARAKGAGVVWSDSPGIVGDGSVILYLLSAARTLDRPDFREVAIRAGRHLPELAVEDAAGGLRWYGTPATSLGLPQEAYFPNFELGTAGIAYVLARLYEETKNPLFLESAKRGAVHLQQIAKIRGTGATIPYRLPDLEDVSYLGFCHGPAGSARLFYQLYKVTQDRSYLDWTELLARGIINSGIPARQTPGFWNVVCQCCGSAGVTDFFLGLWAATGNTEYYRFANLMAAQALSHQTVFDNKGIGWYQAWTRVKPWDVSAETGYSIGAAGIGVALLHTSLAQRGRYAALSFPDNPFPSHRDESRITSSVAPEELWADYGP